MMDSSPAWLTTGTTAETATPWHSTSVRLLQFSEADPSSLLRDGKILRNTFMVYGPLLAFNILCFCWIRQRFPRPFTVRRWTTRTDLYNPLAQESHGFLSWTWKLYEHSEEDLLQYCGLDAVCFLRTLRMGLILSLVGVFNSAWLMPVYRTATAATPTPSSHGHNHTTPATATFVDPIVSLTVSNLPSGSPRFLATVLAAYILQGMVMYLIVQEFQWFTEKRKQWLQRPQPHNYSIYVRNIPSEYRTNTKLARFFQECFLSTTTNTTADTAVVREARIRVTTNNITRLVQKRQETILKLENAYAVEQLQDGIAPLHSSGRDAMEVYAGRIQELNQEIARRIEEIEAKTMTNLIPEEEGQQSSDYFSAASIAGPDHDDKEHDATDNDHHPFLLRRRTLAASNHYESDNDNDDNNRTPTRAVDDSCDYSSSSSSLTTSKHNVKENNEEMHWEEDEDNNSRKAWQNSPTKRLGQSIRRRIDVVTDLPLADAVSRVADGTKGLVNTAKELVVGKDDGEYYDGGFVTFQSLSACNAARQLVHHSTPFEMQVFPAPHPRDVFWVNVGRSNQDLQVGKLISIAATGATCLFWTIPTTFFSSLSSLESLSQQYARVADFLEQYPGLLQMLQVLAPHMLIVCNSVILPGILRIFSMFEGPVSGSVVEASTFAKQSSFMIIQTFFVSAISGSLLEGIKEVLKDPFSAIDLLASSLPSQSTYFMQICFIRTVMYIVNENWRVVPLFMALLRRFIGPRLTKKQRNTVYKGLRPLSDPAEFELSFNMAQICVLYFVILLVYQAIAPLTSFVLAFCFRLSRTAYLHQFIYIYPSSRDSGGVIWINFIKILLVLQLIAEFTVLGILTLNKAAIAIPFMIPLIVITMLFNAYIRQEHFRVTEYLPSRDSRKRDLANGSDFNGSFLKGQYLQEELQHKELYPDDLPCERAKALGLYLEQHELLDSDCRDNATFHANGSNGYSHASHQLKHRVKSSIPYYES